MKKIKSKQLLSGILIICAAAMLLPLALILSHALLSTQDVITLAGSAKPALTLIPPVVSGEQLYGVLVENQRYLDMFFNSLFYSLSITLFNTLVAFLSGYVLAKVSFLGRGVVYILYVLFMVMPQQVTILPIYIVSKLTGLYGSWWSLILPGIFAPLGVFLMRQFILSVPDELCACVRLETKSTCAMLFYVFAPCVKAGLIALFVIVFAENWNMVEQPLLLLSDPAKYPLSLALNGKESVPPQFVFAGAAVFMLPALLIYLLLKEKILNGLEGISK